MGKDTVTAQQILDDIDEILASIPPAPFNGGDVLQMNYDQEQKFKAEMGDQCAYQTGEKRLFFNGFEIVENELVPSNCIIAGRYKLDQDGRRKFEVTQLIKIENP